MIRPFYYLIVIALGSVAIEAIAATKIQFKASQVSGVAPMAVHFDAVGTTDESVSDPFRELRYDFDFGDPSSGRWKYSGLNKNTQSGAPLAAHVYDKPGTYIATLNVGNDSEQLTIVVNDPDVVFSGTKTVCLSRNADMTACPPGAQQITNIRSWPTIKNDRRYMLHAGQNFSTLGNLITYQIHDIQITSFGLGAKPVLAKIFVQEVRKNYKGPWTFNVDIVGLSPTELAHGITGHNILFYKNTLSGPNGIFFAHGFPIQRNRGTYSKSLTMPMNLFAIENVSTIRGGRHTGEGQTIWLGNLFDNTKEHNLRLWQSYKSIVSHNKFPGHATRGGKENIKTHARGLDEVILDSFVLPTTAYRTSYVVISNNILNSPDSQTIWNTIGAKPQDRRAQEGLENYIMENNTHIDGGRNTTPGAFAGRNITTRNEIFAGNVRSPSVNHLGQSLPQEWQGPYYIDGLLVSTTASQKNPSPVNQDSINSDQIESSEKSQTRHKDKRIGKRIGKRKGNRAGNLR